MSFPKGLKLNIYTSPPNIVKLSENINHENVNENIIKHKLPTGLAIIFKEYIIL